jgi:ribosomal subunit interface protein
VEIVVRSRHTDVADGFRAHATDKLAKLDRLDHKVLRLDVELSREHNPRQASVSERVELTCHSKGPVIRAEAAADDPYAALDLATAKLQARLRRAADRRRVHHGSRTPVSVAAALAPLADVAARAADGTVTPAGEPATRTDDAERQAGERPEADGGLVVREKVHRAAAMTLDQALFEMELVGHDFFLFADADTGRPSVVYRRRGYAYGVLRLES